MTSSLDTLHSSPSGPGRQGELVRGIQAPSAHILLRSDALASFSLGIILSAMETLTSRLVTLEKAQFLANWYRGLDGAPPFTFVGGSIPTMVSAPHAVTHWRNGAIKASEDYTGSIALELARITGAHAVVSTRFDEADPNWDPLDHSAYKQALVAYVKEHGITLLLDIHGMVTASPDILALGTGAGANVTARPDIAETVFEILSEHVLPFADRYEKHLALDGRYAARRDTTIASTVARECSIACLQVELSTLLRFPGGPAGNLPPGENMPFTRTDLDVELSARRNPNPAAVQATFDALCHVLRLATR